MVDTEDLPFLGFEPLFIRGAVESEGILLDFIETEISYRTEYNLQFDDFSTHEGYVIATEGRRNARKI